MISPRRSALLLLAVVGLAPPERASAQYGRRGPTFPAARVAAANALIGGTTAAVRAALGHRNVTRAFATGAIGGVVHAGGKVAVNGSGDLAPWLGLAVSSIGTSITANAGQGLLPLEELHLPVGSARIRWSSRAPRSPRLAINLVETAIAIVHFRTPNLAFDARRSLRSGAFVFETRRRTIVSGGDEVSGVAFGSTMVISQFASNPDRTFRHEVVHVRQFQFFEEVLGRPLEGVVRSRRGLRRIPSWLEVGGFWPGMRTLEGALLGRDSPVYRHMETEADLLTRR